MFTVDSAVDVGTKSAKVFSSFIPDSKFREKLDNVIDAQADLTKAWYNSIAPLSKSFVETTRK